MNGENEAIMVPFCGEEIPNGILGAAIGVDIGCIVARASGLDCAQSETA